MDCKFIGMIIILNYIFIPIIVIIFQEDLTYETKKSSSFFKYDGGKKFIHEIPQN